MVLQQLANAGNYSNMQIQDMQKLVKTVMAGIPRHTMIPPRDVAKAFAPFVEAMAWQPPGVRDERRDPRGFWGYKASEGLVVLPPLQEDWYYFLQPSDPDFPRRKGTLIEFRNVKIADINSITFSKEVIKERKQLSDIGLDVDNRDGDTTTRRIRHQESFANGETELEEIKTGISVTASAKAGYGGFEADLSTTVTHEWGKQTGHSTETTIQRTINMETLPGTHKRGMFVWEEETVERTVTAFMRLDGGVRLGGGEYATLDGHNYKYWHRRKHDVTYDSILDAVAIMQGRGNPRHHEYGWYFSKPARRPPKKLVDKIKDLPECRTHLHRPLSTKAPP